MIDYASWAGKAVYDKDDNKVGSIADLYFGDNADIPEWATVKSGFFGSKVHFAPLTDAQETEDGVKIDVTGEQIKHAPNLDANQELSEENEKKLFQHYKSPTSGQDDNSETDKTYLAKNQGMRHEPGKSDAQTISREIASVRLKKYTFTNNVKGAAPRQDEEVIVERESTSGGQHLL